MLRKLWRLLRRVPAGGRSVDELAEWLNVPRKQLVSIEPMYRRFTIPKRSGGQREILAPSDDLKRIQRRILRRVLNGLTVHPCATGFERGRSIVDNALPHRQPAVLVKLDIIEFFPSTEAERIRRLFLSCGWGRAASDLLTHLCTYEGSLPQGAPTSPRLSNLVNRLLDEELENIATGFGANYTRYADDMTFSFSADEPHQVSDLLFNVRHTLGRWGYTAHHRHKLSVRRRHQRQEVTGLIVNGDRPRLPRETRRWLRAVRHRVATRGYGTLTAEQLTGWESLERMIELSGTPHPISE